LQQQLGRSLEMADARREERDPTLEELQAIGVVVVLEGADPAFPLKIDALERDTKHRKEPKRPQWLLLSVSPAIGSTPERAMVWVSDEYRSRFMALFEGYLNRKTPSGAAYNSELMANIGRIRAAVLDDSSQTVAAASSATIPRCRCSQLMPATTSPWARRAPQAQRPPRPRGSPLLCLPPIPRIGRRRFAA
jgi:hypothetical protein